MLERKPDWVLSGVNHGFNLGEDVFYSGTVGAAFEGRLQGARAAAFSIHPEGILAMAEPWIARFLERWEAMDLPANRIWNVNLPKGEPKGFRLTGQDSRDYHDSVEKRARSPRDSLLLDRRRGAHLRQGRAATPRRSWTAGSA